MSIFSGIFLFPFPESVLSKDLFSKNEKGKQNKKRKKKTEKKLYLMC